MLTFSKQSEIVRELNIDKPSIYRIVLRYVNLNNETLVGLVTVTPETPNNINVDQKFMVNTLYTCTQLSFTYRHFLIKGTTKTYKKSNFCNSFWCHRKYSIAICNESWKMGCDYKN